MAFAAGALVPPGVVTVTFTVAPAVPAGDCTLMSVGETLRIVAAVAPNFTSVAPVKLAPKIVTVVAPVAGPRLGKTVLSVGGSDVVGTPSGVPRPVGPS